MHPHKLTPEQVAECVEIINSNEDLDEATDQEFTLYITVLRAIADGAPQPELLAAVALGANIEDLPTDH